MQLAACTLSLTIHNQVHKPSVTPPEVAILRAIHQQNYTQGDPVSDIRNLREYKRYNPATEVARLRARYGQHPKKQEPWVDVLFPGVGNNFKLLPQSFDDVKFVPAQQTADGVAPSRIFLEGEPGYEEPVAFVPPVPVAERVEETPED